MNLKEIFLKYIHKFGIFIIIFLNIIIICKIILFYQNKKAIVALNNKIISLESKIIYLKETINNGLEEKRNQMIELEKQLSKHSNYVFSLTKFSQPQIVFSENFN
ncbi:MAG: hypothetical protein Q8742_01930 [Candidatus Phytoplasma australasiaticum]|nr:hypothetical protein [Candidatus Phytoplasma australasiaticum]